MYLKAGGNSVTDTSSESEGVRKFCDAFFHSCTPLSIAPGCRLYAARGIELVELGWQDTLEQALPPEQLRATVAKVRAPPRGCNV